MAAAAQPERNRAKGLRPSRSCPCFNTMTEHLQPLKQSRSYEYIPPDMSEREMEGAGLTTSIKSKTSRHLNLVLCGRRGAGKTSAARVILGQTELQAVSSSSECVRNQGEVCGRWLSLVELPALYGKARQEVMEESFRCISLCDPEGVHAFILVLPVGPLTDEDKGELQTIQDTFSSRVDDFTMILFTVDSDPTAPAVVDLRDRDRNIQELCESCGGRYVVLNIRSQQQVPEMLRRVEKNQLKGCGCFTKDMFTKALIERVIHSQDRQMGGESVNQILDPLRIVLFGKSGNGKSATANTILGKEHFKPRIAPKMPNKYCEEGKGEMDGRPVVVVNTPPLFDSGLSDEEYQQEIQNSIGVLSPGPHLILLVLRIGNFAPEEKDSLDLIKKYLGRKSQDFTMIIFTRGDALESLTFDEYLNDCQDFKMLIQGCKNRCHVLNNKDHSNKIQVTELRKKMEAVVKENNGCCYSTEMTNDSPNTEMEGLLKEKDKEKKQTERNLKALQEKLKEQKSKAEEENNQRVRQLKEKDECIKKEREKREKEKQEHKKQEEAQRREWKMKLDASERKFQQEREKKENAEKKLEQMRREMKKDRDVWEKEKDQIWEQRHHDLKQNLEEEKTRNVKLQECLNRNKMICVGLFLILVSFYFMYTALLR